MSTEPTETHDRGEQEDAEKPDVDSLLDAPPQSEVVPLETLRRNDLERGGGKGANLGELISVGLPVPPGFCVTTAAYRRAVAETGLAEAIDEALRDVRDEDLASTEAASAGIGTLFEDLPLPDDLAEAILAAYRSLGVPPVAVRSSATTEDLPGASFAGQQATSLNVRGGDELLGAVRRCWASLLVGARHRLPEASVLSPRTGRRRRPAARIRRGVGGPIHRHPRDRSAARARY